MYAPFRCLLHGSYRRHYEAIQQAGTIFAQAGITVLAPTLAPVTHIKEGFAYLATDQEKDQRLLELLFLEKIKVLGKNGFSYFVNPEGTLGTSTSYELGIIQATHIPAYFQQPLYDHPAYTPGNTIWEPQQLADYLTTYQQLPEPSFLPSEKGIHSLWKNLIPQSSLIAVGAIIRRKEKILLVKTHKWGGRYSVIGGKVQPGETLHQALEREIREETGLTASIGKHLCTFDQLKHSG